MRKHSPTLFIECLATGIVETYKDLAGIAKNKKNNVYKNGDKKAIFHVF